MGNIFAKRRDRRESSKNQPCVGENHVHQTFICMNCKEELICRNCKYILGDQHICKLCTGSLKSTDVKSISQSYIGATHLVHSFEKSSAAVSTDSAVRKHASNNTSMADQTFDPTTESIDLERYTRTNSILMATVDAT